MACGGIDVSDEELWERTKDCRNVRELFRGRFTGDEAYSLLRYFEWERDKTVQHVLDEKIKVLKTSQAWDNKFSRINRKAEPGELNSLLSSSDVETRISCVTRDEVLRDLARKNTITPEVRQYGCADCDNMWWRRVPIRKPVSRCYRCKQKYDPVPRDREWGTGQFECECGNVFLLKEDAVMGETKNMCRRCHRMCSVKRILPPFNKGHQRRQSKDLDSCSETGSVSRKSIERTTYIGKAISSRQSRDRIRINMVNDYDEMDDYCMHSNERITYIGKGLGGGSRTTSESKPKNVLYPSGRHFSTGSTVNTFLDQDDIKPDYEPSLLGIPE